ncbi:unnamed protein product [Adineta ricciae]|uniref:Uncharacterized protein n=1 Tax=Adineta ricciae TaxID=249248 RepID=A0A813QSK6_ADIRI|nr:unnamed protein product [Adineta ricciae]
MISTNLLSHTQSSHPWRANPNQIRRISEYPTVHQYNYERPPLPKRYPQCISHRRSSPWTPRVDYLQNSSLTQFASSTSRDSFGSFFKPKHASNNENKQREKFNLRRAILLLSCCLGVLLLLGLLLALLLGLLQKNQPSTTTVTTHTITTTVTTSSTTSSLATTTTTDTSTTTETTTVTTSTTTSTQSTTSSKFYSILLIFLFNNRTPVRLQRQALQVSTTTATTSSTTVTTTTAFNCASTITSTLGSYSKTDCPDGRWHTFSKSFASSYTGLRTLVFAFTNIKHAVMYLTNIKVYDASNTQLISNGDFSSSSGVLPTNWLKCSDNGQVDSTCTRNTSISCYTISAAGGTISQSFAVVSGANYTISFDLYHDAPSGNSDQINLDISAV